MIAADVHWAAIIGTVAAILAAAGTLAAVILALYLQYWQDRRTRPSLSLHFDPSTADISIVDRPPWVEVWVRFRVANARGRKTARRVSVLALNVRRLDGGAVSRDTIPVRELSWSDVERGDMDIPPGVERRIDVVNVYRARTAEESAGKPWPETGMGIALYPRVWDGRDFLGKGDFEIELLLTAEDADATTWRTTVAFLATETDDDPYALREALHVTPPIEDPVPRR